MRSQENSPSLLSDMTITIDTSIFVREGGNMSSGHTTPDEGIMTPTSSTKSMSDGTDQAIVSTDLSMISSLSFGIEHTRGADESDSDNATSDGIILTPVSPYSASIASDIFGFDHIDIDYNENCDDDSSSIHPLLSHDVVSIASQSLGIKHSTGADLDNTQDEGSSNNMTAKLPSSEFATTILKPHGTRHTIGGAYDIDHDDGISSSTTFNRLAPTSLKDLGHPQQATQSTSNDTGIWDKSTSANINLLPGSTPYAALDEYHQHIGGSNDGPYNRHLETYFDDQDRLILIPNEIYGVDMTSEETEELNSNLLRLGIEASVAEPCIQLLPFEESPQTVTQMEIMLNYAIDLSRVKVFQTRENVDFYNEGLSSELDYLDCEDDDQQDNGSSDEMAGIDDGGDIE